MISRPSAPLTKSPTPSPFVLGPSSPLLPLRSNVRRRPRPRRPPRRLGPRQLSPRLCPQGPPRSRRPRRPQDSPRGRDRGGQGDVRGWQRRRVRRRLGHGEEFFSISSSQRETEHEVERRLRTEKGELVGRTRSVRARDATRKSRRFSLGVAGSTLFFVSVDGSKPRCPPRRVLVRSRLREIARPSLSTR